MDGNIFQIISDNFGIIVAIIALIICSILAFKFAITFDVNKFLESRKKRHLGMARNLCLHMEPFVDDDTAGFKPFLISPAGTPNYYCQRCGAQFMYVDEEDLERQVEYYLKNPKAYKKRLKQYNKHMKKAQ